MSNETVLTIVFVALKIISIPIWLPVVAVYIYRKYFG